MTDAQIRSVVFLVVLDKFDNSEQRREESLREYFSVAMPDLSQEEVQNLAAMIPNVMPELYGKWIDMFVDTLLEKIPRNQIEHLCDGTDKNRLSLLLTFLMFMESERMEDQVQKDLEAYGREHSLDDDMGGLVGEYLRSKISLWKEENPQADSVRH